MQQIKPIKQHPNKDGS